MSARREAEVRAIASARRYRDLMLVDVLRDSDAERELGEVRVQVLGELDAALRELDAIAGDADPRELPGDIAGPGGAHDVDQVVVDTSRAILLDYFEVSLVRTGPDSHAVALLVAGRINRTTDRARVIALTDEDGAAALVSEVVALAGRAEAGGLLPGFRARVLERLDELAAAGNLRGRGNT